jgi:hypothetical protein
MNKERLLEIVQSQIQELESQIDKRREVIRRTTNLLNFQIDPWKFDEYYYRNLYKEKLISPFKNDKQLQEYLRTLRCLNYYSQFIKDYCDEHSIKYFGIPLNYFYLKINGCISDS